MKYIYHGGLYLPDPLSTVKEFLHYANETNHIPETVRGNSRQKLIDNGKATWPAAKTRKGHR